MSKIGGEGTAQIFLRNSNLAITAGFLSEDYRYYFPNAFTLETCMANLKVSDISIEGTLGVNIANTFESAVKDQVEKSINAIVCTELDGIDSQVTYMLKNMDTEIKKYLPPSNWSESDVDPLQTSSAIPKN